MSITPPTSPTASCAETTPPRNPTIDEFYNEDYPDIKMDHIKGSSIHYSHPALGEEKIDFSKPNYTGQVVHRVSTIAETILCFYNYSTRLNPDIKLNGKIAALINKELMYIGTIFTKVKLFQSAQKKEGKTDSVEDAESILISIKATIGTLNSCEQSQLWFKSFLNCQEETPPLSPTKSG